MVEKNNEKNVEKVDRKSVIKFGVLLVFFITALVVQLLVMIPAALLGLGEVYSASAAFGLATILAQILLLLLLLVSVGYSWHGFIGKN
jgi:hypothetical protein